jgi:L-ascorbate metabolism protein UlaG (beta-lactamase superfamily)
VSVAVDDAAADVVVLEPLFSARSVAHATISAVEGSRMDTLRRAGQRALALIAALAAVLMVASVPSASPAHAQGAVTLEWFGWSVFRLTSVNGKVIMINPFLTNPDTSLSLDDLSSVDLILPADGHPDETGQTVAIAQKTGARVFSPFELGTWLTNQGVPQPQVVRAGPGARLVMDGITVRMVESVHGSGMAVPDGWQSHPYGGPAVGFYITFENGYTVYFTGSSAATQDQALWGASYKPDLMIFHMEVAHDPIDVANSIRLTGTDNPNLKMLIPHHHRVQVPAGGTTIADVQGALSSMGISTPITEPVRSQVYTLTK